MLFPCPRRQRGNLRSWRNISVAVIDRAAFRVEWLRESCLRADRDSGAQLHHHARKMVAGTSHADCVHSRYGLLDHAGFQPETALTVENAITFIGLNAPLRAPCEDAEHFVAAVHRLY